MKLNLIAKSCIFKNAIQKMCTTPSKIHEITRNLYWTYLTYSSLFLTQEHTRNLVRGSCPRVNAPPCPHCLAWYTQAISRENVHAWSRLAIVNVTGTRATASIKRVCTRAHTPSHYLFRPLGGKKEGRERIAYAETRARGTLFCGLHYYYR